MDASHLIESAETAYAAGNFTLAHDLYLEAAQSGDSEAQTILGWMYDCGVGATLNQEEAIKWYTLAADQNSAEAFFYLGAIFQKLGHWQDAAGNYEKAANNGHLQSAYRLGAFYRQLNVDGKKWLVFAAEQDHVYALGLLGRRMLLGVWPGGRFKGLFFIVKAVFVLIKIGLKTKEILRDDPQVKR